MRKNSFLLIFIVVILSSCGSLKMTSLYKEPVVQNDPIDEVFLFSYKDSIPSGVDYYAEVTLKIDLGMVWETTKQRIIDFAKDHNSNGLVVKEIGWGLHGRGFYLRGELFYLPEDQISELHEKNNDPGTECYFGIFRDQPKATLGVNSSAKITVNDDIHRELRNKNGFSGINKWCDDIDIIVNGQEFRFEFNDQRFRYFKLSRISGGNASSNMIGLYVGGYKIEEIEDALLGKLITDQY